MITGHHDNPDPGLSTSVYGATDILAQRVDKSDQAKQGQGRHLVGADKRPVWAAHQRAFGNGQAAVALTSQAQGLSFNLQGIER